MALTADEASEAYRFLSGALREQGLAWVATQVEEKLALGKIQSRKLRARSAPEYDDKFWDSELGRVPRPGKTEVFAVSEDYSPQERLEILLEAIVLAVPAVIDVGETTLSNLSDFGISGELVFEPEAEVREPFSLNRSEVSQRTEATVQLLRLIDELRSGENFANQTEPTR